MQPPKNVTCPVCGRPNRAQDQCTFCGASLREVLSARQEPSGAEVFPPATGPANDRNEGIGHPSSAERTRPWEGPSLSPKFAGFWIRVVAYMIDGFLINLILTLLVAVGLFGYVSGSHMDTFGDLFYAAFNTNWSFLQLVDFLLTIAYFTFFLGTRGQTPGKMLCGLKVVRLNGNAVTYGQAAVRTLGYYLNLLTLCIGFLWVAFDPRKQGLHDKIAGTYEIRIGVAEIRDWRPPHSYGQGGTI